MADGVAVTPGTGVTIATDDAGATGHIQLVKIAYSADGIATHGQVDADGVLVNLGANNDVTVTSGTITLGAGSAAIGKLAANSGVDIGDVDITSTVLPVLASSATITTANDSASSAQLLASSATRKAFRIYNDSPYPLYVKYGATATTTDFTVKLEPYDWLVENHYYGRVDGIWSANGSGAARITSLG